MTLTLALTADQRILLSRRNIDLHKMLEEKGLVVSRNIDIHGVGITESLTVSVPQPNPDEDANKDQGRFPIDLS